MAIRVFSLLLLFHFVTASAGECATGGAGQSKATDDDVRLERALKELSSSNVGARGKAKRRLLTAAGQSAAVRRQVIDRVVTLLDNPGTSTEVWYNVADLLGELKATEAAGFLANHLDYNDGVAGFSSGHFPALRAVIKIGEGAVPALVKALSEGRPAVRGKAALALGTIGGAPAREALERALSTEEDEEVRSYVRIALSKVKPN